MAALIDEVEAIRARLRTLERRGRCVQGGAVLVGVLVGAGLLMGGQAPPRDQVMEGQRFSLKDADGKERAWLGMARGRPVLRFLNAKGEEHAGLEMSDQGITLHLLNARSRLQTGLSLEDRGVAIVTFDRQGRAFAGENAVLNHVGTGLADWGLRVERGAPTQRASVARP
jgi:hypothetical protein